MILIRKIVNVSLATLLLVATTGITLNKHYCMGRLKSVSINDHIPHCCEQAPEEKMPCCEDISEKLKVEEITQVSFDFDANPDLYPLAIINFILDETHLVFQREPVLKYHESPPPLPDQNMQVRDQVFLI